MLSGGGGGGVAARRWRRREGSVRAGRWRGGAAASGAPLRPGMGTVL